MLENFKEKLGNEKNKEKKIFDNKNLIKTKTLTFTSKNELIIESPQELCVFDRDVIKFQPIEFQGKVNTKSYDKFIEQKDYEKAFLVALKLNEKKLIIESIKFFKESNIKDFVLRLDDDLLEVLKSSVYDIKGIKLYSMIEALCLKKVKSVFLFKRRLLKEYLETRKKHLISKYKNKNKN